MDNLNYIDKIVKSKLENYSVPVKTKTKDIFKNTSKKVLNKATKYVLYSSLTVAVSVAGLLSIDVISIAPKQAIAAKNYKFSIDNVCKVDKKVLSNITEPEQNIHNIPENKDNGKDIVVIEIEKTEIDTVKR